MLVKKLKFMASCLAVIGAISCDSNNNGPSTRPSPYAAYQPTSGQNLAPGIAPYAHGDPEWPMDVNKNGGGGGRR
jgi:hypothetical protein